MTFSMPSPPVLTTSSFVITTGTTPGVFWSYTVVATGETFEFAPPIFEADEWALTVASNAFQPDGAVQMLTSGVAEHRWRDEGGRGRSHRGGHRHGEIGPGLLTRSGRLRCIFDPPPSETLPAEGEVANQRRN